MKRYYIAVFEKFIKLHIFYIIFIFKFFCRKLIVCQHIHSESEANIDKLLQNLTGKNCRTAQFRTVIALIINGEERLFDGIVRGSISEQRRGACGFGYDPVFVPEGYTESFAEMSAEQKNSISHRSRAAAALNSYLETL